MRKLKLFEGWKNSDDKLDYIREAERPREKTINSETALLNNPDYPIEDEIVDYLIDKVDLGDMEVNHSTQGQMHLRFWLANKNHKNFIYFDNKEISEPFAKSIDQRAQTQEDDTKAIVYLKVALPKRVTSIVDMDMIYPNDIIIYTFSKLRTYLRKFVSRSGYRVNIIACIVTTDPYNDPLSVTILRFEFL